MEITLDYYQKRMKIKQKEMERLNVPLKRKYFQIEMNEKSIAESKKPKTLFKKIIKFFKEYF